MAYVIAEPCINVKDTACVDVCPVDCIHSTDTDPQYYINPDECIECAACEAACPVSAIFSQDSIPEKWQKFIAVNRDYYSKK